MSLAIQKPVSSLTGLYGLGDIQGVAVKAPSVQPFDAELAEAVAKDLAGPASWEGTALRQPEAEPPSGERLAALATQLNSPAGVDRVGKLEDDLADSGLIHSNKFYGVLLQLVATLLSANRASRAVQANLVGVVYESALKQAQAQRDAGRVAMIGGVSSGVVSSVVAFAGVRFGVKGHQGQVNAIKNNMGATNPLGTIDVALAQARGGRSQAYSVMFGSLAPGFNGLVGGAQRNAEEASHARGTEAGANKEAADGTVSEARAAVEAALEALRAVLDHFRRRSDSELGVMQSVAGAIRG
jgi:hypothetical protein